LIYLERKITRLSLAVRLTDDLSPDKKTLGEVFLDVSGARTNAIKHNTGYFLLLDLPEGKHVLTAGGKFYENGTLSIDTKLIDPKNPFIEIPLNPKSNYPFPKGMTILKGKVIDMDGRPVFQANISVLNTPKTTTENNGGYYIHFPALEADETVTLDIFKDGYKPAKQKASLKKGDTTNTETTVLTKV
jgi:hypothetical protein